MKRYESKIKVKLKESEKLIFKAPIASDFIDKLGEVEAGQHAEFYSYDEYASGVNTMVIGDVNILHGALIIRRNSKEYISLKLSQVLVCKYFIDNKRHIFDFELKSHGSATLIL